VQSGPFARLQLRIRTKAAQAGFAQARRKTQRTLLARGFAPIGTDAAIGLTTARSLSDLTLFYCGKTGLGHFCCFPSLNNRLFAAEKQQNCLTRLPLATNG
jgi:hypothetical protein